MALLLMLLLLMLAYATGKSVTSQPAFLFSFCGFYVGVLPTSFSLPDSCSQPFSMLVFRQQQQQRQRQVDAFDAFFCFACELEKALRRVYRTCGILERQKDSKRKRICEQYGMQRFSEGKIEREEVQYLERNKGRK